MIVIILFYFSIIIKIQIVQVQKIQKILIYLILRYD
jgi:hypothetical protein